MKLYIDSDRKYEKNRKSLQPLGFSKKPVGRTDFSIIFFIFYFFHIFDRNHDIVPYKFGINIRFCIRINRGRTENRKSEKSKKMRRSRVAISLCLKFGGKAALQPNFFLVDNFFFEIHVEYFFLVYIFLVF